jgi:transposase-like protein
MKEQFSNFIDSSDEIDIITLFQSEESRNEIVELFMNAIIKAEFEMFMGYKKYQRTDLEKLNYRNGSHKKTLRTTNGEVTLEIPEDRNSDFYPASVPKHMRRTEDISRAILELFSLGNSNSEVVKFVDNVFGSSYSPQTVSNIVAVLDEVVQEFNSRKLKKSYFCIFMDATYIPVRFDGSYEKHAVYIMVGVDQAGYQEIIGYKVGFSETCTLWEEMIVELKERGLEQCNLFVMDGAPGVPQLIKRHFNNTKVQQCTVHLMRSLSHKIKPRDRKEVMSKIKNLYYIADKRIIELELDNIIESFPQYERVLTNYRENEFMFTYLDFPVCVHKLIKTTNRIERINGKIKTLISHKRSFPNQNSLERILVSALIDVNTRSTRTVSGMQEYIETK